MHTFVERIYDFYVLSGKCYMYIAKIGLAVRVLKNGIKAVPDSWLYIGVLKLFLINLRRFYRSVFL